MDSQLQQTQPIQKSACHPASAFSVSLFSAIDAYTTVLDFFQSKKLL
jgi:hypothetical protein